MTKPSSQVSVIIRAMLAVAFLAAACVGIIYHVTKKPIQEAQNKMIAESIKEVIPSEFDNDPFAEKITLKQGKERFTLYPARLEGYVTAIAMKSFSNKGYGGKLDVLVSFLLDGTIGNYKVIKHQETPGLGSKVNDESFKKGIIGKSPASETFKVKQDGGEIDAITGATITSRALIDAIQKAYHGYQKFNAGVNHEAE